jgi:hypothetical protein
LRRREENSFNGVATISHQPELEPLRAVQNGPTYSQSKSTSTFWLMNKELSYKPYFFYQPAVFSSHNRSRRVFSAMTFQNLSTRGRKSMAYKTSELCGNKIETDHNGKTN